MSGWRLFVFWHARCVILLAGLGAAWAQAAELRVAVAANFMVPMQKIAAAFERESGHKVLLSLGSTGRLYAQIKNGAPFDLLLAADEDTPARLEKEGLAVPGSRIAYATGRLVLWSRDAARVDDRGEVLRRGGSGPLAIADPKLSPYGRAAQQALQQMGVWEHWRGRLVQGESIAQAHQYVASANAPLGLVALAQVMEGGRLMQGSGWVVPASMHMPIRQEAVLLRRGQAGEALMRFLKSGVARSIVRGHGYED
jgi:molybdate transport system substrate-binding protein